MLPHQRRLRHPVEASLGREVSRRAAADAGRRHAAAAARGVPARNQPGRPGRRASHAGVRDDADDARLLAAVAAARPSSRHGLALRGLPRARGRRALSRGGRASEGRPAARSLHPGAGDEPAARRRRDLPDAAAAPARRRLTADPTGPQAATDHRLMRPRPAVALAALALAACARGKSGPPDLILTGGRIFTADSGRPWAEALAVRGDRIVAVGRSESVRRLAGPHTRAVDLGGRTVIPGLNDAHAHPGPELRGTRIAAATGDAGLLEVVRALAAALLRAADVPIRWRVIRFPMTRAGGRDVADARATGPSPGGTLGVSGVKYILDGTPVERGAAMRRPYADRPGWYGELDFPPETL